MDRTTFETELRQQGYAEVVDRRMEANSRQPRARARIRRPALVLEGAMTITAEGQRRTYRAGDTFAMTAGCRHTEQSGPEGARYLAGRRYPGKG